MSYDVAIGVVLVCETPYLAVCTGRPSGLPSRQLVTLPFLAIQGLIESSCTLSSAAINPARRPDQLGGPQWRPPSRSRSKMMSASCREWEEGSAGLWTHPRHSFSRLAPSSCCALPVVVQQSCGTLIRLCGSDEPANRHLSSESSTAVDAGRSTPEQSSPAYPAGTAAEPGLGADTWYRLLSSSALSCPHSKTATNRQQSQHQLSTACNASLPMGARYSFSRLRSRTA